jgi:hypothetical protein
MRTISRLGAVAAAGALAVAAPAAAKPPHPAHPTHPAHPPQPATSHRCLAHNEAYTASGTLISWNASQTGTRTFSGTVTVHVTKPNHHAAATKGSDVNYTLSNSKVAFGHGANPPTAGDRVKVIGRINELGKKCTQTGSTVTVTVRMLKVQTAKK